MKTVKRKAEVGERIVITNPETILPHRKGEIHKIVGKGVDDRVLFKNESFGNLAVGFDEYEVIIDDKPAGLHGMQDVNPYGINSVLCTKPIERFRVGEVYEVIDIEWYPDDGLKEVTLLMANGVECSVGGKYLERFAWMKERRDAVISESELKGADPVMAIHDEMHALPPHSAHYHTGSIDVIRFAEENFSEEERRGFYRMSAMKYLTRYDRKGTPVDDLEKAQFYIGKLMDMEHGRTPENEQEEC